MCMGLVIDYTIAVRALVTLYISYTTTDDKISTETNNEMVFSWFFEVSIEGTVDHVEVHI